MPLSWFLLLEPTRSDEDSWRPNNTSRTLQSLSVWNQSCTRLCTQSGEGSSKGDKALPGSPGSTGEGVTCQPATTAPGGVNAGRKGGAGAQRRRHCTPVEWESFRGSYQPAPNPRALGLPTAEPRGSLQAGHTHLYLELVSHQHSHLNSFQMCFPTMFSFTKIRISI